MFSPFPCLVIDQRFNIILKSFAHLYCRHSLSALPACGCSFAQYSLHLVDNNIIVDVITIFTVRHRSWHFILIFFLFLSRAMTCHSYDLLEQSVA